MKKKNNVLKKVLFTVMTVMVMSFSSTAGLYAAEVINFTLGDQQLAANVLTLDGEAAGLSTMLGLEENESLVLIRKTADQKTGLVHLRYQQYYENAPVEGRHILVTEDASGTIVALHGKLVDGIALDIGINSTIDGGASAAAVLDDVKEQFLSDKNALVEEEWTISNEKVEEVVYVVDGIAVKCYKITFYADTADGNPHSMIYYVQENGDVIEEYNNIQHDNAAGPGGNEKTGQYEYGTTYGYLDAARNGDVGRLENADVKTVNLNHGTSDVQAAYAFSWPRSEGKSINGAYSPLNDAHYFGGVVFDMYNNWCNTAPLTFQLKMRVHYGRNYENAFWNGSSMTFGDGYSRFYPLVSLDVVSHEVSHGFTQQNSGLIYRYQSGGINEAFSDIAGEAAEYFMKGSNDYMVGADIFKSNGALRYMDDPTKDGRSIGHADDYYNGMDVHYSSGVFNRAFYLLSSSSGWTVRKAFEIFVLANQAYWEPSTTFEEGAAGVLQAAKDLGYNETDVINAFKEVGIDLGGGGENWGVEKLSSTSALIFYKDVNVPMWVDVHYVINGGGRLSHKMEINGSRWEKVVDGLSAGDVVGYYFTIVGVGDSNGGTYKHDGDYEKPTTPGNLNVTGVTSSSISLNWLASTDNVGVTGYNIYVNDVLNGTTDATVYTIGNLSANTTYAVSVRAKDEAGNLSDPAAVSGTTAPGPVNGTFSGSDPQFGSYSGTLVFDGQGSVAVTCSANPGADNILIYPSTGGGYYMNDSDGDGIFSHTITGVQEGQTITVKVVIQNPVQWESEVHSWVVE